MGCNQSKDDHKETPLARSTSQDHDVYETSPQQETERAVQLIHDQMENDFEKFLLNYLLLSVVFFKNYTRDMRKVEIEKRDKTLNHSMLEQQQKSCLKPDKLSSILTKNVKYTHRSSNHGNTSEPILPTRAFVIHDNIEVLSTREANYSDIDYQNFKTTLVDSEHSGFTKLKCLSGSKKASLSSSSSCSSDGNQLSPGTSQDSDDYGRINNHLTERPINSDSTPIKSFITNALEKNYDYDENNKNVDEIDLSVQVPYLNSQQVMKQFKNDFKNNLGEALGFESSEYATYSTAVFCDKVDGDFSGKWEILPCVLMLYPDSIAYEWYQGKNRKKIRLANGKEYQWPATYMLELITKMQCVLIPRGFMPKHQKNPNIHLEWEIAFPKAEKYLLTKISHAQMRAYIFFMILHKTFIHPDEEATVITTDHIKTCMFWQFEMKCWDWSDTNLGEKMLAVMDRFYECLAKRKLTDYFIRNKDLFINIPSPRLRKAQAILHDIKENPLIHFLYALDCLEYSSDDFPTFDFKALYAKLRKPDEEVANIDDKRNHDLDRREDDYGAKTSEAKEARWMRLQARKKNAEKKKKQEEERRKKEENMRKREIQEMETFDLTWTCPKLNRENAFDIKTKRSVIMQLLDHYIKIIHFSISNNDYDQVSLYNRQAELLALLLNKVGSAQEDAENYLRTINKLQIQTRQKTEPPAVPPQVPDRNSSMRVDRHSSTSSATVATMIMTKSSMQIDAAKLQENNTNLERRRSFNNKKPVKRVTIYSPVGTVN